MERKYLPILKDNHFCLGVLTHNKLWNIDDDIDGVTSGLTVEELVFAACRGGWPSSLNKKSEKAMLFVAQNYIANICDSDASTVDGVKHSTERVRAVLQSYARNISTLAKDNIILRDVSSNYSDITSPTLSSYVDALEKRYALIEFKLGSKEIEEGDAHLLQLKKLIKQANEESNTRLKEPTLLIVITGGEMAYTRNDGVKIIPIGTLKD